MYKERWNTVCWLVTAATLLAAPGCGTRQVSSADAGPDVAAAADLTADTGRDVAALDLAAQDLPATDLPAADMNQSFPAVLEGVWLIGWSGGMNHFSWLRFSKMATRTMSKKDAWLLEGKAITSNLPLWACSGKASYWMGAAGNTIYLDFPSKSCLPNGSLTQGYVFSDFNSSGAGAPKGAILSATVKIQATLQPLSGYKYPASWCDAAMTSCKAPW